MSIIQFCLLSSLAAVHINSFSKLAHQTNPLLIGDRFVLPAWISIDSKVDQLSWQGLPMKIEFFSSTKRLNYFLKEISSYIPEGTHLIKKTDGWYMSWLTNNISYVLMIEDTDKNLGISTSLSNNSTNNLNTNQSANQSANLSSVHDLLDSSEHGVATKGILSTMLMVRDLDSDSAEPHCHMNWLPQDARLIFSMGDKVGGVKQARIDGYISNMTHSEVRSIVMNRLKQSGWIKLAESAHYSPLGGSAQLEAHCGSRLLRINLQKNTFQTRISVMSIEK